MGRGRGKGRKLTVANNEDTLSGEEEKIPVQRRRGRPQKPPKDEIYEAEAEMLNIDEEEDIRSQTTTDNGKRKRNSQLNEKNEDGSEKKLSTAESVKSNGFRQIGSRRKSTPRRAAESVVECE